MQDTENGRRWVAELRSDRWTQGTGRLEEAGWGDGSGAKHCCLGVLVKGVLHQSPEALLMPLTHHLDEAGMTSDEAGACWGFNDTQHLSFLQIANIVERAMDERITVQAAYDQLYSAYDGVIPSTGSPRSGMLWAVIAHLCERPRGDG